MLALAARILPYAVGRLAAYLLWGLASLELLLVLPETSHPHIPPPGLRVRLIDRSLLRARGRAMFV